MNKPNILVYYPNPNSYGSIVKKIHCIFKGLCSKYRIILICPARGKFTAAVEDSCDEIIIYKFTENYSTPSYLKAFFKFSCLLLKYRPKFLFIPDYNSWRPAELVASKILKFPFIVAINFYKSAAELKGIIKYAHKIICNSHSTAKTFIESGHASKTYVIHNSLDLKEYDVIKTSCFSPIRIGYLGILHPIKGIDVLLQAAANLQADYKFELYIAGSDAKAPGYRAELEELTDKLKLKNITTFVGHIEKPIDFLKTIDILVVPSRLEPFGYTNIEAAAAHLPVVASSVGGIPEIIIDGKTGFLFESENCQELAEKLAQLLQNPELIISMGKAARAHIEENFNLDKKVLDWLNLLG